MTTVSVTSPLKLLSYPTTRRTASFPMLATRVRSSSTGGVASSESSLAAQAPLTKPTSRTSPLTGGSRSRSRPSSPAASSTKPSSRYVASSTSSTSSTRTPLPTSPSLCLFCFLVLSCLVSSHHTRSLPPSPSRSSYLLARCRYRCRGSLFRFVFFFVFFVFSPLANAVYPLYIGGDLSRLVNFVV